MLQPSRLQRMLEWHGLTNSILVPAAFTVGVFVWVIIAVLGSFWVSLLGVLMITVFLWRSDWHTLSPRLRRVLKWGGLMTWVLLISETEELIQAAVVLFVATVVVIVLGRLGGLGGHRTRWLLKWGWTGLFAVMLFNFASSGVGLIVEHLGYDASSTPLHPMWMVDFSLPEAYQGERPSMRWWEHVTYVGYSGSTSDRLRMFVLECPLPWHSVKSWWIGVPFGWVLIFMTIPTAFLWYLDRRRFPAGCCQKCGYDLTGNQSGRCPECGTEVAPNPRDGSES
jgi:hypothetical protein